MQTIHPNHSARLARWDIAMRRWRDLTLFVSMAWLVLALLFMLTAHPLIGFVVTVGLYVCLVAMGLFAILSVLIVPVEMKLARDLVRGKHEEAVALLLQVLDGDDGRTRRIAARALIRTLPRVRSLTSRELEEIAIALLGSDPHQDSGLMIVLLESLGKFGTRDSLESVERIAMLRPITRTEKRVQKAALSSIVSIRRRIDRNDSPMTSSKHPRAA